MRAFECSWRRVAAAGIAAVAASRRVHVQTHRRSRACEQADERALAFASAYTHTNDNASCACSSSKYARGERCGASERAPKFGARSNSSSSSSNSDDDDTRVAKTRRRTPRDARARDYSIELAVNNRFSSRARAQKHQAHLFAFKQRHGAFQIIEVIFYMIATTTLKLVVMRALVLVGRRWRRRRRFLAAVALKRRSPIVVCKRGSAKQQQKNTHIIAVAVALDCTLNN